MQIRTFLAAFILLSCSSLPEGALVRKIPAKSESEAKSIIFNHVQFLKTLFVQTRDPYYNVLKWTEECLQENIIGAMETTDAVLFSKSVLYMKNNEPGFCSRNSDVEKMVLLYTYCPNGGFVSELKMSFDDYNESVMASVCDY